MGLGHSLSTLAAKHFRQGMNIVVCIRPNQLLPCKYQLHPLDFHSRQFESRRCHLAPTYRQRPQHEVA